MVLGQADDVVQIGGRQEHQLVSLLPLGLVQLLGGFPDPPEVGDIVGPIIHGVVLIEPGFQLVLPIRQGHAMPCLLFQFRAAHYLSRRRLETGSPTPRLAVDNVARPTRRAAATADRWLGRWRWLAVGDTGWRRAARPRWH